MPIKDSIIDLRQMRRSIKLREETDPEAVANILEQILKEAVHVQSSGSRSFQKRALQEMKQVQKDLVHNKIGAVNDSAKYVGLYGHVIDALESFSGESDKNRKIFDDNLGSLRDTIPSSDTLIAALMTANPLLGYGVKMMKGMATSSNERRKARREESNRRLELLQKEASWLEEQLKQTEEQAAVTEIQEDNAKQEKRRYSRRESQIALLKQIRDEIKVLQGNMGHVGSDPSLATNGEDPMDLLVREMNDLEDALNAANKVEEESTDKIIHAESEAEELDDRQAKLERMREDSADQGNIFDDPPPGPVNEQENNNNNIMLGLLQGPMKILKGAIFGLISFFSGIVGSIAGLGLMGALLAPLKGLFSLVFGLAKIGLKVAKFGGFLAIVGSVFDLIEGFLNPEPIANKDNVTLGERIRAVRANVVAGLVKSVDQLTDMFDFSKDWIDSEGIEKTIYQHLDKVEGAIVDTYMGFVNFYVDSFKGIRNILTSENDPFTKVTEIIDFFGEKIKSLISAVERIPVIGKFFSESEEEESNVIEDKQTGLMDAVKKVPYVGKFFSDDEEGDDLNPDGKGVQSEPSWRKRNEARLLGEESTKVGSGELSYIEAPARTDPIMQAINRVEKEQAERENSSIVNQIIAPNNTRVNNVSNTYTDGGNTSNNDFTWRDLLVN